MARLNQLCRSPCSTGFPNLQTWRMNSYKGDGSAGPLCKVPIGAFSTGSPNAFRADGRGANAGALAVIGARNRRPVIKLRRRTSMSGCSRVIRKSICDRHPQGPSGIHVPTLPSPVCSPLEDARHRVRLGEKFSQDRNFHRVRLEDSRNSQDRSFQ